MAKIPLQKKPPPSTPVAKAQMPDDLLARAKEISARIGDLELRIAGIHREEQDLRLDALAAVAPALPPEEKLKRLAAITEVERHARDADRQVWELLDQVFALRHELLARYYSPIQEVSHDDA